MLLCRVQIPWAAARGPRKGSTCSEPPGSALCGKLRGVVRCPRASIQFPAPLHADPESSAGTSCAGPGQLTTSPRLVVNEAIEPNYQGMLSPASWGEEENETVIGCGKSCSGRLGPGCFIRSCSSAPAAGSSARGSPAGAGQPVHGELPRNRKRSRAGSRESHHPGGRSVALLEGVGAVEAGEQWLAALPPRPGFHLLSCRGRAASAASAPSQQGPRAQRARSKHSWADELQKI